ncbi:MAG: hypothetical protein CYPHOPRED_005721 [Cyphobasidiales sp. Tagirdzhanova-0007]|nr:MAG: hypothetical protein CYPHOPRED_005721 [Cyphobasidiales sp. Tagirdzhanova-0007]
MTAALKSLVVPPSGGKAAHNATVIFAHGLGDSGNGWSFLADQLGGTFPYVKFIFPHAPTIPITLNGGYRMPAWFDLRTLRAPVPGDPRGEEDEQGILESVKKLQYLVDEEVKAGIEQSRIVVGGFSQGAAIGLIFSLLTESKASLCQVLRGLYNPMYLYVQLAGFICLSGWLPMDQKALRKPSSQDNRLFMGHGRKDPTVQYVWGEASYKVLKEKLKMPNVEFNTYSGLAHSADEQELNDLALFLQKILPAKGK